MELSTLFSWQEGYALDLWSIMHLFWGAIGGLLCILILKQWHFAKTSALAFTVIVLWEYGEYLWGINESIPNIIADIIIGFIGFILGYKLPKKLNVDPYIFLIPLTIVVIFATYIGWINYIVK